VTPRWRRLLQPRLVVPIALSLALLGFVLGLGDLGRVGDRLRHIAPGAVATVFALTVVYLVLKGIQLRLLLRALDIHPRLRSFLLAYAVGEMTLPVPSGIYIQNYLLTRLDGAGFARSAAATTAVLAIEWTLVGTAIAVLGVPGWSELRPAALAVCFGAVASVAALLSSERAHRAAERVGCWPRLGGLVRGGLDLADGLRGLASPRVLAPSIAVGGLYLMALVGALMAVADGMGLQVGIREAASVYFFSLGVTLVFGGVLSQLGVIEVAGLAAARAWGLDLSDALAMLLGFRLAWMGSIWLLSGTVTFALWSYLPDSAGHGREEAID
jgi:hypothetical protein